MRKSRVCQVVFAGRNNEVKPTSKSVQSAVAHAALVASQDVAEAHIQRGCRKYVERQVAFAVPKSSACFDRRVVLDVCAIYCGNGILEERIEAVVVPNLVQDIGAGKCDVFSVERRIGKRMQHFVEEAGCL